MNRSKLIEKETSHVGLPEPKSHKMGLQVSRRFHPEVRGYFESTVGIDEVVIRKYIREQEKNDDDRDQKKLF